MFRDLLQMYLDVYMHAFTEYRWCVISQKILMQGLPDYVIGYSWLLVWLVPAACITYVAGFSNVCDWFQPVCD